MIRSSQCSYPVFSPLSDLIKNHESPDKGDYWYVPVDCGETEPFPISFILETMKHLLPVTVDSPFIGSG